MIIMEQNHIGSQNNFQLDRNSADFVKEQSADCVKDDLHCGASPLSLGAINPEDIESPQFRNKMSSSNVPDEIDKQAIMR